MSQIAENSVEAPEVQLSSVTRFSIKLLAILGCCSALYFARSFFLPFALSLVIALTMSPIVQFARRFHLPVVVSSVLLVIALTGSIIGATMTLATPFADLLTNAPQVGRELKQKLDSIITPVASINQASSEVDKITGDAAEVGVQQVVIKQPGLLTRAADDVAALIATTLLTLVLIFFWLISRDMFFAKVVRVLPTLSDKKRALSVAKDIENDVSKYLLTVTIINTCLGVAIGFAFWVLGMDSPVMWGVAAGLLNFLPYIGSLIGIVASAAIALIASPTVGVALIVPLAYFLITLAEGQFITPILLGRRFSLNTVVILIAIAFWGFLWGPVGVFIAVPLLIILKVFCDRVESLSTLGEFLSGEPVVINGSGDGPDGDAERAKSIPAA